RLPLTSQSSEPLARSTVTGWALVMPRGTYVERSSASSASVDWWRTVTRPFKQIRSGTCGGRPRRRREAVAGARREGGRARRRDHESELQGRGRGRSFRPPHGRRKDGAARHRSGGGVRGRQAGI